MLKTAGIFNDHMVLQHGKEIAVWGEADYAAEILITIQNKTFKTAADKNGQWNCKIGPLEVSEKEEMSICSTGENISYQDIAVGDVWLAGGQSNMEMGVFIDYSYEEEKKACENSNIRFYDCPKAAYEEQMTELPHTTEGFWRRCDPENLKYFSAVGYFFAKKIQTAENIPIGIVGCNWGGSTACCWMDKAYVENTPAAIWWKEYEEETRDLDMSAYNEAIKSDMMSVHNDWIDTPFAQYYAMDATYEALKAAVDASMAAGYGILKGPKCANRPSGLYETMLKKIVPYGLKGVIFYQGESDDVKAELYGQMMEGLVANWRSLWQENLPFLFVQIAPYEGYGPSNGDRYPEIREQQQWAADHLKNVGMAVISDAGDQWNIHPRKKRIPGERLALQALNKVYGKNVVCESPRLTKISAEDNILVLHFDHADGGLVLNGSSIHALEVLHNGADAPWQLSKIDGENVYLETNIEPGSWEVKLAAHPYHEVNLYNHAGLPARAASCSINI